MTIKQPFFVANSISAATKLLGMAVVQPINWVSDGAVGDKYLYYQRKTAPFWEEGDSKLLAQALKVAGIKVNIFDPKQLIAGYNYQMNNYTTMTKKKGVRFPLLLFLFNSLL